MRSLKLSSVFTSGRGMREARRTIRLLSMQACVEINKAMEAFSNTKLRSEIVWHRFFAVPAFICRFRSYIAVR